MYEHDLGFRYDFGSIFNAFIFESLKESNSSEKIFVEKSKKYE